MAQAKKVEAGRQKKISTGKIRVVDQSKTIDLDAYKEGAKEERLDILKTYKIYIDGKFPRTESGRYYPVKSARGDLIANICRSSRKDLRDAVVAARKAFEPWAQRSAYNRGQIVYRIAEMLEGRKAQFVSELELQGSSTKEAAQEVNATIDRLVYYAGWADKYQQVFSCVNPVSSSHFNFSLLEPTGVVSIIAPEDSSLLGLISATIPAIVGGNTCIALASASKPLCAVTFSEVVNSSDVPGGVLNLLTGFHSELVSHFSSHMDINAVLYFGQNTDEIKTIQTKAALNIKRVSIVSKTDWLSEEMQSPYAILETQETKTTWHPVGV